MDVNKLAGNFQSQQYLQAIETMGDMSTIGPLEIPDRQIPSGSISQEV